MEDLTAPSFSLGFDLDLDAKSESSPQHTQPIPIDLSSTSTESEEETINQNAEVEDPRPLLKRLKRGPPKHLPVHEKKEPLLLPSKLDKDDDEIEDFSSPEDSFGGGYSLEPKYSVCSSSKFALNGHTVLNTKIVNKQKTCNDTPGSKSSATSKLMAMEDKLMFPKLTVSPLRRFQLLDSDSDDPSVAEDEHDKADKVNAFGKEQCKPTQSTIGNKEKESKQATNTPPTQDLWKDFSPVKNVNMRAPATNRLCKENVVPEKGKNVVQSNDGHTAFSFSRANAQKNNFHADLSNPLPPCYNYFHHGDSRIQSLVCERLPNFSPLSVVDSRGNIHSDVTVDYMSQFGHKKGSSQFHGSGKNTRSSYAQGATISGSWFNTQSCPNVPNDVGKRRVHADCRSAGQWYTSQDGTRVYVSKSGQPMTGQSAYRQYRKESGVGYKRSSKKAAAKKK